jgi:hypothetical protein
MPYRILFAAAMLCSASLVAPRPVLGSCGDWLAHSSNPRSGEESRSDQVSRVGQGSQVGQESRVTKSASADFLPPRSPSRPCDGPGCQQSPIAPLPSPSSPTSDSRLVDLACSSNPPLALRRSATRIRFDDSTVIPRGCMLDIDRPPKS